MGAGGGRLPGDVELTQSDAAWADTLGLFQSAALGLGSWENALRGLARATNSNHGELIGLDGGATPAFAWISDFPVAEATADYRAVDGHTPMVNSRVRVGARAPELRVIAEGEDGISTEDDVRRFQDYGAVIARYDIPYHCLVTLVRRSGLLVGLSVLRSAAQGPIRDDERRFFALLAPHVRAAVLTQIALQENAAALVAGALEAVSLAAFVCDFEGRVKAMSPLADALVGEGRLKLREGRLAARHEADTRALAAMVHEAAFSRNSTRPPSPTLVLRDLAGADPLLVEVSPVAGQHAFGFGVGALVVVRGGGQEPRVARQARALFGLTPMESQVVAGLVAGRSPAAIAETLGVAVGTVRTHVRGAFEKVQVRSVGELVAAVTRRL